MANNHRHSFLTRNEVIGGYWKLNRLFENPKVKKVLVGCAICHPRKKFNDLKKVGRVYSLED